MSACLYCQSPLNDSYNFCLSCNKQVKCIHCGSMLVPDKPICFVCGRALAALENQSTPMNEFTLEERQTRTSSSRTVKGRFSDAAFSQATALLSGLPPSMPLDQPMVTKVTTQRPALPDGQGAHQDSLFREVKTNIDESASGNHTDTIDVSNKMPINRYFESDGKNSLIPLVADFKGTSKKEQQQRFMLLFISAYNQIHSSPMSAQKLMFDAMRVKGMYDTNTSKHFASVESKYLIKSDNGYRVNYDGQKEVEKIILDIEDTGKKGFVDWDKPGKPRSKQTRISNEDDRLINQWVDMQLDIGGFDIRTLKSATNYALFSIFVLTKRLNVDHAIKPVAIFQYLKRKFITIPINQKALSRALKRPYNASLVHKTSDGRYYLTPEGEKKIQSWLQGAPVQVVDEPEVDTTDEDNEGDE